MGLNNVDRGTRIPEVVRDPSSLGQSSGQKGQDPKGFDGRRREIPGQIVALDHSQPVSVDVVREYALGRMEPEIGGRSHAVGK